MENEGHEREDRGGDRLENSRPLDAAEDAQQHHQQHGSLGRREYDDRIYEGGGELQQPDDAYNERGAEEGESSGAFDGQHHPAQQQQQQQQLHPHQHHRRSSGALTSPRANHHLHHAQGEVPQADKGQATRTVVVRGVPLHDGVEWSDILRYLRKEFNANIRYVKMEDSDPHQRLGTAYVVFHNPEDAMAIMRDPSISRPVLGYDSMRVVGILADLENADAGESVAPDLRNSEGEPDGRQNPREWRRNDSGGARSNDYDRREDSNRHPDIRSDHVPQDHGQRSQNMGTYGPGSREGEGSDGTSSTSRTLFPKESVRTLVLSGIAPSVEWYEILRFFRSTFQVNVRFVNMLEEPGKVDRTCFVTLASPDEARSVMENSSCRILNDDRIRVVGIHADVAPPSERKFDGAPPSAEAEKFGSFDDDRRNNVRRRNEEGDSYGRPRFDDDSRGPHPKQSHGQSHPTPHSHRHPPSSREGHTPGGGQGPPGKTDSNRTLTSKESVRTVVISRLPPKAEWYDLLKYFRSVWQVNVRFVNMLENVAGGRTAHVVMSTVEEAKAVVDYRGPSPRPILHDENVRVLGIHAELVAASVIPGEPGPSGPKGGGWRGSFHGSGGMDHEGAKRVHDDCRVPPGKPSHHQQAWGSRTVPEDRYGVNRGGLGPPSEQGDERTGTYVGARREGPPRGPESSNTNEWDRNIIRDITQDQSPRTVVVSGVPGHVSWRDILGHFKRVYRVFVRFVTMDDRTDKPSGKPSETALYQDGRRTAYVVLSSEDEANFVVNDKEAGPILGDGDIRIVGLHSKVIGAKPWQDRGGGGGSGGIAHPPRNLSANVDNRDISGSRDSSSDNRQAGDRANRETPRQHQPRDTNRQLSRSESARTLVLTEVPAAIEWYDLLKWFRHELQVNVRFVSLAEESLSVQEGCRTFHVVLSSHEEATAVSEGPRRAILGVETIRILGIHAKVSPLPAGRPAEGADDPGQSGQYNTQETPPDDERHYGPPLSDRDQSNSNNKDYREHGIGGREAQHPVPPADVVFRTLILTGIPLNLTWYDVLQYFNAEYQRVDVKTVTMEEAVEDENRNPSQTALVVFGTREEAIAVLENDDHQRPILGHAGIRIIGIQADLERRDRIDEGQRGYDGGSRMEDGQRGYEEVSHMADGQHREGDGRRDDGQRGYEGDGRRNDGQRGYEGDGRRDDSQRGYEDDGRRDDAQRGYEGDGRREDGRRGHEGDGRRDDDQRGYDGGDHANQRAYDGGGRMDDGRRVYDGDGRMDDGQRGYDGDGRMDDGQRRYDRDSHTNDDQGGYGGHEHMEDGDRGFDRDGHMHDGDRGIGMKDGERRGDYRERDGRMDDGERGDRMDDGGRGGRMDDGGRGGRMDDGGRGGRMDDGGRGGRMDDGGRGGRMDDGGRGERMDDGGRGDRMDDGGRGDRMDDGGRGGRMDDGDRGDRMDDGRRGKGMDSSGIKREHESGTEDYVEGEQPNPRADLERVRQQLEELSKRHDVLERQEGTLQKQVDLHKKALGTLKGASERSSRMQVIQNLQRKVTNVKKEKLEIASQIEYLELEEQTLTAAVAAASEEPDAKKRRRGDVKEEGDGALPVLIVSGFPPRSSAEEIHEFFSAFGPVQAVSLASQPRSGDASLKFSVEFPTFDDTERVKMEAGFYSDGSPLTFELQTGASRSSFHGSYKDEVGHGRSQDEDEGQIIE